MTAGLQHGRAVEDAVTQYRNDHTGATNATLLLTFLHLSLNMFA
jgi:hypothetical protein